MSPRAAVLQSRDVSLSLLLNLGAVALKLELYGKASSFCNKALALDEGNVKGLFRQSAPYPSYPTAPPAPCPPELPLPRPAPRPPCGRPQGCGHGV